MSLITLESTSIFSSFSGAIISTEHHPISLAAEQSSAVGDLFLEHDLSETVEPIFSIIEELTVFSPISGRSDGQSSTTSDLLKFYPLSSVSSGGSSSQALADLERQLTSLSSVETLVESDITAHVPETLFSMSKSASQVLGEIMVTRFLTGLSEGLLGSFSGLRAEWNVESLTQSNTLIEGFEQYLPFLVSACEPYSATEGHLSKVHELEGLSNGQADVSTNAELRLIGRSDGQSTSSANDLRICLLKALIEFGSSSSGELNKQSYLSSLVDGNSETQSLLEPWISLFSRTPVNSLVIGSVEHEMNLSSKSDVASETTSELFQIKYHLLSSLTEFRSSTLGSPIGGWPVADDVVSLIAPIQRQISLISRRFQ